jgi:hypothetical protein
MEVLYLILFVVAVVLFVIAAFGPQVVRRINLVALGLAFGFAVFLIQVMQKL